jgi:hypothetical protein
VIVYTGDTRCRNTIAALQRAGVGQVVVRIAWLFVGGSIEWKLKTGHEWTQAARSFGGGDILVHIGRVGSARRIAWAQWCGAHSIDSSLPLWSEEKLASFLEALKQPPLFIATQPARRAP